MLKNYIKNLVLLVLVLFAISANAQVLSLQQTNTTTGAFRAVAANETVSFPTAATAPSVLTFRITNTSAVPLQLTGTPTVAVTGVNASLFTVSQPALTTLALNQSTIFTVTYQPTAAPVNNAQISIINNSATSPFVVNLKGAGHSLYGPMYPVLPVFGTITTGSNSGVIGRSGGKDLYISTVSMGTQTTTYWGPQISSDGDLGLKVSLDNSAYTLEENLTYSSAESNFAAGKAVWRGRTFIQNAITNTTVPVYIRATLTTKKPDNSIITLINPATIGLSEQVGGLVQFSSISDFLVANYFIEASLNQVTWQPYLDFYDAYPTPPGPLPGAGIGNAYSTVSNGFYWINFGPTMTQNQILSVAEGGTAAITTSFLNATDKEDMPASPQKLVFRFETTNPGTSPLNFGTGVLKLNGVTLTKTDTFTLKDIQDGLLTYEHNGFETVYDEFQFSLIDSKSKIAADGPNTIFSFKINITAVNDAPVTQNLNFTTSYVTPFTNNLTVTDPDSTVFTYTIVTPPTQGTINLDGATGQFTYTPTSGTPGTDTFTYSVNDGTSTSNISTVTITLINLPPTGINQQFLTMEDVATTGNVVATDPEGGAVTYQLGTQATDGIATVAANGAYTYTPNTAQYGNDTFTYIAQDAQGNLSSPVTITITVRPRLDPGDIIVADEKSLVHYDPATSQSIILSQNQGLNEAINVAFKNNVGLFVYDKLTGLIKVDPTTGMQTLVTPAAAFSGAGPIGGPPGMLIDDTGFLVMCDAGGIKRVNPANGVVTPLFSGGLLSYPTGLAYLNSGDLLVSDAGMIMGGTSRIIRITPAGVQTVLSTGNNLVLPLDIALLDQNTLVVTDGGSFAGGTDKIYKVDTATGVQTMLSTGGNINISSGIDVFQNTVYAVNKQGTKLVLNINGTTGVQSTVPGPALTNPWGLLVIGQSIIFNNTTITNTSCTGSNDGSAVVTFSGGTAPYTYTLNGSAPVSATSPLTLSNLTAGSYNLLITDSAAATASTTIVIGTVTDVTNPTITAPANINVNADAGSCNATGVVLGTPVFADNCTGSTVANDAPANFPIGNTTVIWTVTDVAGNTATATQTVTVTDNQNPTITAPANINVNADAGSCNATGVVLGTPVFADNCTGSTIGNNAPAAFPIGNTTVTWTVTDASGNMATATQTVTVTDNQNPTITAPANVNANTDAGSCTATGVVLGTPVFADNCTGSTIGNNAPAAFSIGNTTVTWTVTDASGNMATATQTVTVTDNQNPTITAPANVNANTDAGSCTATGVALGTPTFADNCTGATVANNAPATFPIGNTTVIWTATDASGNTATATQTVTVTDNQNPSITAPANINVNADAGNCNATGVVLGTPTFADNCTGATVANNAPTTFPKGNTTVTWTVTDASGNTATATQTVTVTDNQNPTITAPANINVNADAGSCNATGVALGTPVFADNCTGATVANNAPAALPIGNTLVTWTATDASGNTATATQTVTVTDNQNPTITAPANVNANTDAGSCTATGVALGTPIFADNCTGSTIANNAPTNFPIGNTTVIWTVTDASGNTATATQTVTIIDNQNPTITAPANVNANTDAGSCTATGVALGTPIFADNCTGSTVANNAPTTFPIGNTTVIWTATDASGNTATTNQTVTVTDNQNPTITAPANVNTNTDPGSCQATVVLGTPIVTDNCTGTTVTNNAPATFPIGMTTVTWTVTDVSGNTATANQFVTVTDNQDPTIVTPPNTTLNVDNGGCQATSATLPVPTFFDNCTGAIITNNAPANFPVGNTIVTWTATDAAGNTTSATQIITVVDNQDPTITAPADVTASINTASCRAVGIPLGTPIVADNCVGPQVTNNAPSSFPIGTTVVTWIAIDSSGNTATDTQNVTITDDQAPTITAPDDITVEGTENCSVTNLNLGQPAATDNCSGFTISNDAPAAFPLGTTVVTWTVTDAAGNITTDTQTVTVTAPEAPVANAEQAFCIGATVVQIQVQGQNIVWYDAETAGNIVETTELLEDDTTYYAATNNSGCESLTRTAVHITIHSTPAPVGSAIQEFCNEATISDLTAAGDQIKWYGSAESTTPLDASVELVNESIYYASQTDETTGCESLTRLTVQSIIHTVPLAEGKTNYTYCSDMTPTITDLAVDYPNSVWYADAAGTILLEVTERLTNGSYYVRLEDPATGCESPAGFEVVVRFMECDVVTYNYLTPDENTKNEYLYFENIENFPDNNLKIFNRQGKKLFETYNYGQNNNYFYGKSSSDASGALPTGTYFYLLEYRNPVTMTTEVKKGFFYINNNE